MSFKRALYASTLAAGVGLTGFLGVGLGTASADPGQCNAPGQPPCGQDQHDNWRPNDNRVPNDNRGRSTGSTAASTKAVRTINRSTGTASR